jgi:hypothetical protein
MESPEEIDGYLNPDDGDSDPPNFLEVDKAWHGIHYLLTGDPEGGSGPLALAVLGGKEVGDEVGYGPARFVMPEEVKAVATALEGIDEADFRTRFVPKEMAAAEIYPEVIWEREGADALQYLVDYYIALLDFYRAAANRGDGVIAWLS